MRAPLNAIDDPPTAGSSTTRSADAEQPRRRKVPVRQPSPPRPAQETTSRYFSFGKASSTAAKGKEGNLSSEVRLSPHRQQALFLPDSDEDMPSTESVDVPNRTSAANSSDYDFDLDDVELVAALDKVEKQQSSHASSSSVSVSQSVAISSSSGGRAAVQTRIDVGVITIDDEEEGEKENVPLPTRQVRRRVENGRVRTPNIVPEDIIELSD
jgi:RecQ-mediated genome instability protein 1